MTTVPTIQLWARSRCKPILTEATTLRWATLRFKIALAISTPPLGAGAGTDPEIGNNNVYIGDPGFAGDENVISIGGIAASGTNYENTYIGGIYGQSVNVGTALPVYVDTDGHLGTSLVNASGKKVRIRSPKGAPAQSETQ
jgi:hypothetical protein